MNNIFKFLIVIVVLLCNMHSYGQIKKKSTIDSNKIEIKRLEKRIKYQQFGSNVGAGLAVVGIVPVLGIAVLKNEMDIQNANTFQYIGLGVFASGILLYALEQKGISNKQQKINRLSRMNFNFNYNSFKIAYNF